MIFLVFVSEWAQLEVYRDLCISVLKQREACRENGSRVALCCHTTTLNNSFIDPNDLYSFFCVPCFQGALYTIGDFLCTVLNVLQLFVVVYLKINVLLCIVFICIQVYKCKRILSCLHIEPIDYYSDLLKQEKTMKCFTCFVTIQVQLKFA